MGLMDTIQNATGMNFGGQNSEAQEATQSTGKTLYDQAAEADDTYRLKQLADLFREFDKSPVTEDASQETLENYVKTHATVLSADDVEILQAYLHGFADEADEYSAN